MNETRIQINGEWYVKESSISSNPAGVNDINYLDEVSTGIMKYEGWVFENDAICMQLEFSEKSFYDIKVWEKISDKKLEGDNLNFFLEFIKNPYHDSEFNNTFSETQLMYLSNFMKVFRNEHPIIK
jgi:hypothetical protein